MAMNRPQPNLASPTYSPVDRCPPLLPPPYHRALETPHSQIGRYEENPMGNHGACSFLLIQSLKTKIWHWKITSWKIGNTSSNGCFHCHLSFPRGVIFLWKGLKELRKKYQSENANFGERCFLGDFSRVIFHLDKFHGSLAVCCGYFRNLQPKKTRNKVSECGGIPWNTRHFQGFLWAFLFLVEKLQSMWECCETKTSWIFNYRPCQSLL